MKTALFFLAFILPTLALANDPLTQAEKDHFEALGKQVLQRIQDYYGPTDLLKGVNFATLPMEVRTNVVYRNEEVRLGSFDNPVIFDFDRTSAKLRFLFNVSLVDQSNPELDQPPKTIWTKEQVRAKAEHFVVAVFGRMPEAMGKEPVLEFTPKVLFAPDGAKKYQCSTWRVVWYRQNKQGIKFQNDIIMVSMTDGREPEGLSDNFRSSYEDSDVQPIPAEKAVAFAKKQAPRIMAWRPGAMWLQDFMLLDQPKWQLQIVNPNHLLTQTSINGEGDARARLAWVVTYPKVYTGQKGPGGAAPPGGYIEIWIDAETGDFLGGTFQ